MPPLLLPSGARSPTAAPIVLFICSLPVLFLLAYSAYSGGPFLLLGGGSRGSDPSSDGGNNNGNRKEKVAFLFLTNSNLSFAPLWERFFRGYTGLFTVYVHADPAAGVARPGGVFSGRFIAAEPTQRASPSLISAERRLLAAALDDDPANAFFALVSQYCVPLRSFPSVYRSLLLRSGERRRSFIEILSGEPGLSDRYVARGAAAMLPEVPFEEFRVGSQFFVLTRRHASLAAAEQRLWGKFRLPCLEAMRDTCYPEEHYFPTLLSMRDPDGCTGYTLTRVNWTDSFDGHPRTYLPGEVTAELVRRLRTDTGDISGAGAGGRSFLFARKFSPDCLAPLMDLADSVLFRDTRPGSNSTKCRLDDDEELCS